MAELTLSEPGKILERLAQGPGGQKLWEIAASLRTAGARVVVATQEAELVSMLIRV